MINASTIIDSGDAPATAAADLRPIFGAWSDQLGRDPAAAPVVELRSAAWPHRLIVLSESDLGRVAAARSGTGGT